MTYSLFILSSVIITWVVLGVLYVKTVQPRFKNKFFK